MLLNIGSVKSVSSQSGIPGTGRKCIAPTALAADADESMIDEKCPKILTRIIIGCDQSHG